MRAIPDVSQAVCRGDNYRPRDRAPAAIAATLRHVLSAKPSHFPALHSAGRGQRTTQWCQWTSVRQHRATTQCSLSEEDAVDVNAAAESRLPAQSVAHRPRGQRLLSNISGEQLRRRERMSGNGSFQRVYRSGRAFQLKHMRLNVMSNVGVEDATCTRIGVVTAKKALKRAVDRNLMRRRIKNVYRTNKSAFPDRVDIIVTVNESALTASYEELKQDLLAWAQSVQGKDSLFAPRRPHRAAGEAM